MTKRLILTLLLSCSPLWATTYYVDNCVTPGNDRNSGTSTSTPWLTINKVNTSKFNPGDSILFRSGCTWREQLTVPSSGAAGKPITFGAYGKGAQPIISGANLIKSWTLCAGSIYYASYSTAPNQVFEDGARLKQETTSAASLEAGQWFLDTVHKWIWVYLTGGGSPSGHTTEASQRACAINVGTNSYVTVSNIDTEEAQTNNLSVAGGSGAIVTGVTSQRAYYRGIVFYQVAGGTISSSTVAYNGSEGINFVETPGMLVEGCVVHDNGQLAMVNFSAGIHGGVDSAGQSTNVVVQSNKVYSNGVGQSINIGWGIMLDTIGTGAIVQYNLTYGNNQDGINIDGFNSATVIYNVSYKNGGIYGHGILVQADGNSSLTGHHVYSNTVWGNYTGGIVFAGPSPEQTNGCTNNVAQNNIAVNTTAGPNFGANDGCENHGTDGIGNVYTNNDFGPASSNFIQWGANTSYSTYSAWETAAGNCGTVGCSHSVQADPQFVNVAASQFWLASSSPAIGAGTNLGSPNNIGLMPGSAWPTGVTTGPTNTPPDIGAFVYVPALAPPSNLQDVAH